MKKKLITLSAGLLVLSIFSCGGGGGGDSSNTNLNQNDNVSYNDNTNDNTSTSVTLTGQFVDAPVAGLEYETSSGIVGVTDANGYFEYREGDTVTFKLGDLILGDSKGDSIVTPSMLFADEFTDPAVLKEKALTVSALLLALDENPQDDVISIPETVRGAFKGVTVDLETMDLISVLADIDGDGEEENLEQVVEEYKDEASQHYAQTLYELVEGALSALNNSKVYFYNYSQDYASCNTCEVVYSDGQVVMSNCTTDATMNGTHKIYESGGILFWKHPDGHDSVIVSADPSFPKVCVVDDDLWCIQKGEPPEDCSNGNVNTNFNQNDNYNDNVNDNYYNENENYNDNANVNSYDSTVDVNANLEKVYAFFQPGQCLKEEFSDNYYKITYFDPDTGDFKLLDLSDNREYEAQITENNYAVSTDPSFLPADIVIIIGSLPWFEYNFGEYYVYVDENKLCVDSVYWGSIVHLGCLIVTECPETVPSPEDTTTDTTTEPTVSNWVPTDVSIEPMEVVKDIYDPAQKVVSILESFVQVGQIYLITKENPSLQPVQIQKDSGKYYLIYPDGKIDEVAIDDSYTYFSNTGSIYLSWNYMPMYYVFIASEEGNKILCLFDSENNDDKRCLVSDPISLNASSALDTLTNLGVVKMLKIEGDEFYNYQVPPTSRYYYWVESTYFIDFLQKKFINPATGEEASFNMEENADGSVKLYGEIDTQLFYVLSSNVDNSWAIVYIVWLDSNGNISDSDVRILYKVDTSQTSDANNQTSTSVDLNSFEEFLASISGKEVYLLAGEFQIRQVSVDLNNDLIEFSEFTNLRLRLHTGKKTAPFT